MRNTILKLYKNSFILSRPCGVVGSPAFIEESPILLESTIEHFSSPEKPAPDTPNEFQNNISIEFRRPKPKRFRKQSASDATKKTGGGSSTNESILLWSSSSR